jgi:hypothetical protein
LAGIEVPQLKALDQAVGKEYAEKIALQLLAEKDEQKCLINLLAHLGGYSAVSIYEILLKSGKRPRSPSTISNQITASGERIEQELGRALE